MHAPSLFVFVPVAIVLVASATRSSASPTMIVNSKHHPSNHTLGQHRTKATKTALATPTSRRTRVKHVIERRSLGSLTSLDTYLDLLSSNHNDVLAASKTFSSTAKKARSSSAHDNSFQKESATGLTSFQRSLGPLQTILSQLGADDGLANYDKSNQLETLLKDITNATKKTLSDVDALTYSLPILGPVLGPIVYEIKCILDELLDANENITDGLLNSIAPLWSPLILTATHTVCRSIIPPIAGLCL